MATLPQTKKELLDHLRESRNKLDQVLASLRDDQITGPRDQAGWSIKDHLHHLAVWEEGIAALLERQPRWQAMGVDDATVAKSSEDEINAIIHNRVAPSSLAETRAALRSSREHLLRALEPLGDADLQKPYGYYQPNERDPEDTRPIMNWIVGNSSGHYMEHLPWIKGIVK